MTDLNYQQRATNALSHQRPCLFTRYASGKCQIVINRLEQLAYLKASTGHAPYLAIIFCSSKNVRTWRKEIFRLQPTWLVIDDTKPFAVVPQTDRVTLLLVRHHRIRVLVDDLIHHRPRALVFDESTAIKNADAQITQAAHRIAFANAFSNAHHHCLRIVLSGDPNPESETELWNQLQFCFGPANNPLGATYYGHLRRWFIKPDWNYILKHELCDKFYDIIRKHSVLFDQQDHEEFDTATGNVEQVYRIHHYQTSPEQEALLTQLTKTWSLPTRHSREDTVADLLNECEMADLYPHRSTLNMSEYLPGNCEEYSHSLSIAMKRQQIASGFYYTYSQYPSPARNGKETIYLDDQPKAEMLSSRIKHYENQGHRRIAVWYHFQATKAIIRAYCHSLLIEVLDASERGLERFAAAATPASTNPSEVREAKRLGIKTLVLAIPLSAARGLNDLAGVEVSIFYENIYSQEMRNQAEARTSGLRARSKKVIYEDLCSPDQLDSQIIAALWAKNLTPDKLNTLVTTYLPTKETA